MASFDFALRFFGPHEWNQRRNFTNIPGDPGGFTNFGITLKSWQSQGSLGDLDHDGDVDVDDLKLVDFPLAAHFYRTRYWDAVCGDQIANDRVAAKVCDMAVNMGPHQAVQYLQEALHAIGYPALVIDGGMGRQTLAATNSADPGKLLAELCHLQRMHYIYWVQAKPVERRKFSDGLLARAAALPETAMGANA